MSVTVTPTKRRTDFWAPFIHPDTRWDNAPDDGHVHNYLPVSPVSLGSFGPTCVACVLCGWIKTWGNAAFDTGGSAASPK